MNPQEKTFLLLIEARMYAVTPFEYRIALCQLIDFYCSLKKIKCYASKSF